MISSPSLAAVSVTALLLITASASSTNAARPSSSTLRALEENGYQYMESLSGYQMQFGKCVRVKVPNDDDDENEGNSYFYNGRFYSQGVQFASVYLCEENGSTEAGQCGKCDTSKEYVTDLGTYLDTTLAYAQSMCQSCNALCYNRRGRQLEEEQEAEGEEEANYMNVNCNVCRDTCKNMNFDNADGDADGDGQADETQYLECQEAFQDESGNIIYAGPQCTGDGDITIGFYYDDECTVKSSSQDVDLGFSSGTFTGIETMCLDCDPYGNGEDDVCQSLYADSTHCSNGKSLNGEEDDGLPICKTLAKSHKEHFYGKHPRNWRIVESLIAVVVLGGLLFAFFALSYTYYLRHRHSAAAAANSKEPLADHDYHSAPEVTITKAEVA